MPASVGLVRAVKRAGRAEAVLAVTIREGRKRQVRQMCEAIGHPVLRLRRVRIGPIADPALRPGRLRALTKVEVAKLKRAARARQDSRSQDSRSAGL
jgi:pseudouridine synthase